MSLAAAYPQLISDIEKAFADARDNAVKKGLPSDSINSLLALAIADAIKAYVTSASVMTSVTASGTGGNSGGPVSTVVSGTGTGNLT
mgnify:CR=1 FL=1|tara:strand:- start:753 stop:1013 length:261 start_codon:yes stop_codon:yes gene_type:complete